MPPGLLHACSHLVRNARIRFIGEGKGGSASSKVLGHLVIAVNLVVRRAGGVWDSAQQFFQEQLLWPFSFLF